MNFINKLIVQLNSKQVGCDEFGNTYFESKKSAANGKKRRFVIYNKIAEPSKIPPKWHLWIHYSSDKIPTSSSSSEYFWQKIHLPNLTGTKNAYHPSGSLLKTGKRNQVSADYQSWQPNK